MKNVLKTFGVIALVAIIGFSMAGCKNDDDDSGGLPAPAGLYAMCPSANSLQVGWNSVSGATGYILYISDDNFRSTEAPVDMYYLTYLPLSDVASGTYYFRVAAYNANGTGAKSNSVSVTVTGSSGGGPIIIQPPQPNLSLNGTWESSGGSQVNINGATGYYTRMGTSALTQDAINKGYIYNGAQKFRNLSKTGTYTWTGQYLGILTNTNAPNVALAGLWLNCTITMSTNGQTITVVGPWSYQGSSGTLTNTFTRQ
jgi:hypothetical protein